MTFKQGLSEVLDKIENQVVAHPMVAAITILVLFVYSVIRTIF